MDRWPAIVAMGGPEGGQQARRRRRPDGDGPTGPDDGKNGSDGDDNDGPLHVFRVEASCDPDTVESEGTAECAAEYYDSLGHSVAEWAWSNGSQGGTFLTSSKKQQCTFKAPSNHSDGEVAVPLSVYARCTGDLDDDETTQLTVYPSDHDIRVSASPKPDRVPSGSDVRCTAKADDTRGHRAISWQWDDAGEGGTFRPSPRSSAPRYTPPANTGDSDRTITLTVTATCRSSHPATGDASLDLTVQPAEPAKHLVRVVPETRPKKRVPSGGTVQCAASFDDTHGHLPRRWRWDDGRAGGKFDPSPRRPNPTYTAAENPSGRPKTVILTAAATCAGPDPATAHGSTAIEVQSPPTASRAKRARPR